MIKKSTFFILMCIWNALFFFLCGYWQQMNLMVDLGVDLGFGVIAVIFISLGEASVIQQVFEYRLVKQIVLLLIFHLGVFLLRTNLINIHGIFYISAFALLLSMGWLKGSEILWIGEDASYYMIENGKVYNVVNVMENTKVFELSCTGKGERDRVITIEKKEAIDEQSRLR